MLHLRAPSKNSIKSILYLLLLNFFVHIPYEGVCKIQFFKPNIPTMSDMENKKSNKGNEHGGSKKRNAAAAANAKAMVPVTVELGDATEVDETHDE